jgi:DNA-binding transcriptional LysR family regulator
MRFRGLDLNLLVALDALLTTRSVSRAAEQLNLSQPALSAALGRIRDFFGDPMLVAKGKRMYPTAYAEALFPQVREALVGIEALISTSTDFDPATSNRTFRLAASDYIVVALLAPLIARLAHSAPGIRIETLMPGDDSIAQLQEGKLDLMVAPEEFVSRDHPADLLAEEQHLVVGWKENPLFASPLTEQDFYASGHVAVAFGHRRTASFADRHLAVLGQDRRIEVTASSFTAVPWLIRNTMRIALMHERLVVVMAEHFPIASSRLPFSFPTMREMVQYNGARASDEGLLWLLTEMKSAAEQQ